MNAEGPPTVARGSTPWGLLMGLLLASLSMGFGALLALYLIMASRAETWPPPGTPHLPAALWASTAIIVVSGVTMQAAVSSIRRGSIGGLSAAALATLLLGVAFLVSQTLNWFALVAAKMPASLNLFAACFYLLTVSHALHILAGLVPLTIVTTKAFAGQYTPASYGGVRYCAIFWHFLGFVWLVIFAVLKSAG